MASPLSTIFDRIEAALLTIDGDTAPYDGDYNFDLTGPGRVLFGMPVPEQRSPPVVHIVQQSDAGSVHGTTLGMFEVTDGIEIMGLVGGASDSVKVRMKQAADLAYDIRRALQNVRQLPDGSGVALTRDLIFTSHSVLDGEMAGMGTYGVCRLTVNPNRVEGLNC